MSRYYDSNKEEVKTGKVVLDVLLLIAVIATLITAGCPYYSVWEQRMTGEAELARASQNRQITIQEAQAKKEAAVQLAQAEIERAKGVAEANKIIGSSLKENEDYLRYLWIDSLHTTKNQVVYVPTEGNLPILEAGKR